MKKLKTNKELILTFFKKIVNKSHQNSILSLIFSLNFLAFLNINTYVNFSTRVGIVMNIVVLSIIIGSLSFVKIKNYWNITLITMLILNYLFGKSTLGSIVVVILLFVYIDYFSSAIVEINHKSLSFIIPLLLTSYWIVNSFLNYRLEYRISVNSGAFNLINSNSIALLLFVSFVYFSKIIPYTNYKGKFSFDYRLILFFAVSILLLESRTALVAMLLYIVLNVLVGLINYNIFKKILSSIIVISLSIPFVLFGISLIASTNLSMFGSKGLISGREEMILNFFTAMKLNFNNWFFGIGSLSNVNDGLTFHNLPLQLIYNFGAIVFGLFVALIKKIYSKALPENKIMIVVLIFISSFETIILQINFIYILVVLLSDMKLKASEQIY